ncbi:MAG TPA: LAGLIDADG family homing endonuclease [Candidatus Nanoarchaeia archaeon]|nr:LAGLIDADG family homing endonuclease [Candidatus Nanoarchaeia archaeon]
MVLLKEDKKLEIIKQIKDGKSLGEIIRLTKARKTTIYYYMKKIRGKRHLPVKINSKDRELVGEIIGVFAGDGYYANDKKRWDRRIKIFFNAKEIPVIDYYRKAFKKISGKKPNVFRSNSVTIIQIHSGDFCNFILSYVAFGKRKVQTIELRDKSLLSNILFTKGFLRGLIDSDGYIRKGRKEIYYGSISKNLFDDFIQGLELFNFNYKTYLQKRKNCSDFYKVRLSGDEVDKFVNIIKPAKRL